MSDELIINWWKERAERLDTGVSNQDLSAEQLAAFFAQQVDHSYISHGELQIGRAIDSEHWSPDLVQLVAEEIKGARENGSPSALRIVTAAVESRLAAMALVNFHKGLHSCYVVLEDLVVDKALRHQGIGVALLTWIEQQTRSAGCRQIYLESGITNHDAHRFFERHGFRPCSIVMMKSVDDD